MNEESISRRKFLKQTSAAAIGAGMVLPELADSATAAPAIDYTNLPAVDRKLLFMTVGDTLIPTATGYAGYRRLETYGITDEVMKALAAIPPDDLNIFNAAAQEFFEKPFIDLNEADRNAYLEGVAATIHDGTFSSSPTPPTAVKTLSARLTKEQLEKVQRVFRLTRLRVFTIFYQNFPENTIKRDSAKAPLLPSGDLHQIINPNTTALVTGWDIANFPGPLTWDEEEKRRAYWKKIHWHEEA